MDGNRTLGDQRQSLSGPPEALHGQHRKTEAIHRRQGDCVEMKRRLLLTIALAVLVSNAARAHEMRPAYLELRQTETASYELLWKVPGRGQDMRLGLYVQLPASCADKTPPHASMINNNYVERRTVTCPSGLTGQTIRIQGLSATMTDVLVRFERLDG